MNCDKLSSVGIPAGVASIGKEAFYGCIGLKEINLPRTIVEIGAKAFSTSGIEKVEIPSQAENLGESIFADCDSLTSATILYGVTEIPEGMFMNCDKLSGVGIPAGVVSIGKEAFYGCAGLKKIDIPNTTTIIEQESFCGCSLEQIKIPNSVKQVGENAFADNYKLETVIITGEVKNISDSTFEFCTSLKNVIIEDGVETIGAWAFFNCDSLETVNIPKSTTKIYANAFAACDALENISVDIENSKFCSIDGNLYSKDKSILFQYASGKKMTSFEIPKNVRKIEADAFAFSKNLESVVIPSSVTKIMDSFVGCEKLTDVYYEGGQVGWEKIYIEDKTEFLKNANIHCENMDNVYIDYDDENKEIFVYSEKNEEAKLIIAIYQGNRLTEWGMVTIMLSNEGVRVHNPLANYVTVDKMKIMIWSKNGITPLKSILEMDMCK